MRYKGKLIKWNVDKAFGFIQPNAGGADIFIHKSALFNRKRTPQINDIITFSMNKGKDGRCCASDATFSGEKLKNFQSKKNTSLSAFSSYLSLLFLAAITAAYYAGQFPQKLLLSYFCLSMITFLAYAFDKSNARHGAWRVKESKLHFFALIGGWPGAAIAQPLLRHKSQKREFLMVFWFTVIINISLLIFLYLSASRKYLDILY
ncbi:cold shock and DUF1294 domain-containing protein [Paraglaciecola psychrophila]|uniref:Cold shock DNA-binding domain-containing protein n=1 Tax=Paraglaciecola psychrophila 170 TaxID=1129794 RepID=K7A3T1_9ALTE|nr:cold shock and DUF1294 domain-containing protein [Paraglaciecola psychrophila]AGH43300.1 cold shock DNA-binding domain-containing protein [Paraglaciecola psychrophila 170]GAC37027.1 hypothetical protein GPSY_1392 [Paraglaciecola psychrophila 170]